ncbi:beta-hydroxyacyl-ACP dehydratase [Bacteroides uniformis]|uniref:beta-hydroxyacyl-ACP dehydratase n=1 Tax=Bacteroides uniformis TaxID=820 RepID=UPI0039B65CF5
MKLENNYYKLISMHSDGTSGVFHLSLRLDCEVYRGHFPGNPVCPGVCNIQMIKECAERLTGQRLHISRIRRCRLTAVANSDGLSGIDGKDRLAACGERICCHCHRWRRKAHVHGL